jgi:nicotinamide-nucleotide amidase
MTLYELSQRLGKLLQQQSLVLTTAESCTGGYIAQMITAVPDSSQWFERGFVTYSNEAKMEMLGVSADTLAEQGAVSGPVVMEMALGALKHGPSGGSVAKPVGTVCFAIAGGDKGVQAYNQYFSGDRQAVREASVEFALRQLYDYLSD